MTASATTFEQASERALGDEQLQAALRHVRSRFTDARAEAVARFPDFDAFRDAARDIKDHTLAHLDLYLEAFEAKVIANGGRVHFAQDAEEARERVRAILREHGATKVSKSKSMVSEEIELNEALERAGVTAIETDLGEYILQVRGERPSHIVAPAVHLTRAQVERDFRQTHATLDADRDLGRPELLMAEARGVLRESFLTADAGLTGANLLVAETGSAIIVTNEGNADLTRTLPRVHIVLASIEKLVPTLEDAAVVLRVLARSATGQDQTVYTTMVNGPAPSPPNGGARAFHVVLVDNGRSAMLGTELQDMLRCIRCGACMNHCPVYQSVGGHAYGWIYPGPMGAVLTPALDGLERHADLPHASTFCGKCEEVCPVRIPLTRLMRHWRERDHARGAVAKPARAALFVWAFLARRPRLYRLVFGVAARALAALGARRGSFASLPFASAWTSGRDLPAPQGASFQSQWRARTQR